MIALKNITKRYRLFHERTFTLRQCFVSLLKRRSYEDFYAVRDIDLAVTEGEFLGIIGKNGSGKSTLLKIMAGVLQPTSGSLDVAGQVAPFLELSAQSYRLT